MLGLLIRLLGLIGQHGKSGKRLVQLIVFATHKRSNSCIPDPLLQGDVLAATSP
jgi:hypothetical protein